MDNNGELLQQSTNLDDLQYQHASARVGLEGVLGERRFRFNLLAETNDPREYKSRSFTMGSSIAPNSAIYDKHARADLKVNEIVKYDSKAAYFREDKWENYQNSYNPRVRGFSKARMWSQHGDDHQGVCLVFSKTKIRT